MPTVPRLGGKGPAAPAAGEVLERGPSPKLKRSTPEERERENPRLSVYDDLIRATAHLPAAERMAAVMPAIMSDPAAWGAGQDLERVVRRKVPPPEEADGGGQAVLTEESRMPKVSSPAELGIGRGAGRLGALNLPQRRATATPETFGAGVRHFDQTAVGGVTIAPHYEPAKSGFELLADTVAKIASIGSETAEKVNDANNAAEIQQAKLQNRTEWLQQSLALEATVEEGADPGEYAKTAAKAFDDFKAKKLEGLGGIRKMEIEEDLGNLGLHNLNEATNFQASRKREYREGQNRITYAASKDQLNSAAALVFADEGQYSATLESSLKTIDALLLPDDQKAELSRIATHGLADALWAGKVERDPYGSRDLLRTGDPAVTGGLTFDSLQQRLGEADREIHRIEGEARQRQREAEADAREAKRDLEIRQRFASYETHDKAAQLGEAFDNGLPVPPEAFGALIDETNAGMANAADPDTKRRYYEIQQGLEAKQATSEFARVANGQSYQENLATREALLTTNVDLAENTPEAAQLKIITGIIERKTKAIQDGETLEYGAASGRTKLTPVDPADPASIAKREQDAEVDAMKEGLPADGKHQRLTKVEAARIAQDFIETPTSDGVMAKMLGYLGPLEDDARRRVWLSELEKQKLPPAVRFAAEAMINRKDEAGARLILGAMTTKAEDLPSFGADKNKAITTAVNAQMITPGSRANLTALRWQQTQEPGLATRTKAERDQMLRITQTLVASGMDATAAAERASSALFGEGELAGDHDISYVMPPSAVDAEQWRRTLHSARAVVAPPILGPLDPNDPTEAAILRDWYGGVAYAAEQDRRRQINLIRRDGVWTDGDDGVYRLLDPTSHRVIATYTAEEIRTMAAQAAAPGLPPKLPGSPP